MNIYNKELEEVIFEYGYIPRAFKPKERLKIYHKYWIPAFKGMVKVIDVLFIEDTEYYIFKYDNLKLDCCLSYPVYYEGIYELLHNYGELENENIINSGISYTGAEIRYWVVKNHINCKELEEYLKLDTPLSIIDNKKYFLNKTDKYEIKEDSAK